MSRLENKQFLKAEAMLLHKLGVADDHEPITDKEQELINYIIYQAQKAEELQAKVDELIGNYKIAYSQNEHHRKLADHYKQALEYYANSPIPLEGGKVARQALKGVEG